MDRSNKPPTTIWDDTLESRGHGRSMEEEKQETVQEDQEVNQDMEEAPVAAGAYAVNRDGVVPRAGRNPDCVTLMSDEPESIDPSIPAPSSTRNPSDLLVQAQLAQVTDEEAARLQEENILLRRSVPLAQAQVAEPVLMASDNAEHSTDPTASINTKSAVPNDEEKKRRCNRYTIIGGVVVFVIAAIVGVIVGVKPWDDGGASGEQSIKQATGLFMSLIGLDTVFDANDSDLWAAVTKEYVEDFYNSRRRRLLRSLQATGIHNVKTSLGVTDTNVERGGNNGTDPSLLITYTQSFTYTFEDKDVSIDYMVSEPFRTSARRMAYVGGLQDAGMAQGEDAFDKLTDVSTGTITPNPSSPPPTHSPTQDPTLPPSTLAPTSTPTLSSTKEPTPSPTVNPTPPSTVAPTTLRPTQASTTAPTTPSSLPPTPPSTLNPTPRPTTQAPTPNPSSGSLPLNGTWSPVGQVMHGKAASDYFGDSVSLSRDGSVMAIGADQSSSNPGYVVVQRYNPSTQQWIQLGQELVGQAGYDDFGESVSINGDGTNLAIGAPWNDSGGSNAGHVRVFEHNSASDRWVQLGSDILGQDAFDQFGFSVSLSDAGDILAVGAYEDDTENGSGSGSVRLFQYDRGSSSWNQLGQTLFGQAADDRFGCSVSLNAQGTIVGVGADENDLGGDNAGQVSVFEYNAASSKWGPLGDPINGQVVAGSFGVSVSLDDSGLIVAAGAIRGSHEKVLVHLYDHSTLTWKQRGQTLLTQQSGDDFGGSVSLSGNGNVLAVGSDSHDVDGLAFAGQVRFFQYDDNADEWKQVGDPLNGEVKYDRFGHSVSLSADGSVVGVGTFEADVNGSASGSVYAFTVNDN